MEVTTDLFRYVLHVLQSQSVMNPVRELVELADAKNGEILKLTHQESLVAQFIPKLKIL